MWGFFDKKPKPDDAGEARAATRRAIAAAHEACIRVKRMNEADDAMRAAMTTLVKRADNA